MRQAVPLRLVMGTHQQAVSLWRQPKWLQALEGQILYAITQTQPPATTRWPTRTIAQHLGTNSTLVQRV